MSSLPLWLGLIALMSMRTHTCVVGYQYEINHDVTYETNLGGGRQVSGSYVSSVDCKGINEKLEVFKNTEKYLTDIRKEMARFEEKMAKFEKDMREEFKEKSSLIMGELKMQISIIGEKLDSVSEGQGSACNDARFEQISSKLTQVEGALGALQTRMDQKLSLLTEKLDECMNRPSRPVPLPLPRPPAPAPVKPQPQPPAPGVCSTKTYNEKLFKGWTAVLRRVDDCVDFRRDWATYKAGFGDPLGNFWLGLEKLHRLTAGKPYKLRVRLHDYSGEFKFAEYGTFSVAGEGAKYKLRLLDFDPESTAGNAMGILNGQPFSTLDRDNDGMKKQHCAQTATGGWWYKSCHKGHLTGMYKPKGYEGFQGINWFAAYGDWRSFKRAEIIIRPQPASTNENVKN